MTYSRYSAGFLASSKLSRMVLVSGLQLPHLVFILRTVKLATWIPISFSHLIIRGGIATFRASR